MDKQLNVVIVDDSVVIRKILTKILSTEANIHIAGEAGDGQQAIDLLKQLQSKVELHVVIMDLEMPRLDGYGALPEVKKLFPRCRVIVASTLTQRGAEASMKALAAGASDYIPKPSIDGTSNFEAFSKDLLTKVRILGSAARSSYNLMHAAANNLIDKDLIEDSKVSLRPYNPTKPSAIAVGASTGGPEALQNLFKSLDKNKLKSVPIFITQHMPPKFTTLLADNLKRHTGFDCIEATQDEIVLPGKVYVAPGDYHMRIAKHGINNVIKLTQEAHINFCRPSVDPMLNSLADLYGSKLLFVMLTGMGNDGLLASQYASSKGANILAQDKETSVVWGMPGAIAKAGICNKVAPILELAKDIMGRF